MVTICQLRVEVLVACFYSIVANRRQPRSLERGAGVLFCMIRELACGVMVDRRKFHIKFDFVDVRNFVFVDGGAFSPRMRLERVIIASCTQTSSTAQIDPLVAPLSSRQLDNRPGLEVL